MPLTMVGAAAKVYDNSKEVVEVFYTRQSCP